MALSGAFVSALAPVCAVACLASARRRPKVPPSVAAGAEVQTTSGTFGLDLWPVLQFTHTSNSVQL